MSAAALVIARAPSAGESKPGLAPLLGAGRRAALHAVLSRRAAAWAAAAAPNAAFVAVEAPTGAALDAVGALLPPGVSAFSQDGGGAEALAAAIERVGRGPRRVAGPDGPRLGAVHAAAALDDLAAGCDVVVGATLEGGWYLAGLREPRP